MAWQRPLSSSTASEGELLDDTGASAFDGDDPTFFDFEPDGGLATAVSPFAAAATTPPPTEEEQDAPFRWPLLNEQAHLEAVGRSRAGVGLVLALSVEVDEAEVAAATAAVVQAHRALRVQPETSGPGRPTAVARLLRGPGLCHNVVTVEQVQGGPAELEEAAQRCCAEAAEAGQEVPLRVTLLRGEGGVRLAVRFAPWCADALSAHIVLSELGGRLARERDPASRDGAASPWALAQWEAEALLGNPATVSRIESFWRETLVSPQTGRPRASATLPRPSLRAAPAEAEADWVWCPIELNPNSTDSFIEILVQPMDQQFEVPSDDHLNIMCLTVLSVLLERTASQTGRVIDAVVSLRDADPAAAAGLVGVLSAEVPVPVGGYEHLAGSSFVEVFRALGRHVACARRRVVLPCAMVRRELGLGPAAVRYEYFRRSDVAAATNAAVPAATFGGGGGAGACGGPPLATPGLELAVRFWEELGEEEDSLVIRGGLWYRPEKFEGSAVATFVRQFVQIVDEVGCEPHMTLQSIRKLAIRLRSHTRDPESPPPPSQ